MVSLDPAQLSTQDVYKLMIGSVVPRPIAFVSTQSKAGVLNLAPFSFYTAVCSKPPTLLFCPARRGTDGTKKDTLINIEETGEFVVNVVTEGIVEAMNQTSADYPPEVSEFNAAGLIPVPSLMIQPPRVLESPVSMECKLQQIIPIGDGGPGSGAVVLGTIVQFHIQDQVYQNGRILIEQLKPVARLAGAAYCPVREIFELQRPVLPQQ